MNLTEEQSGFFNHHNIDLKLVFDATWTWLVWKELKEAMHNSDTIFAVWTNKCNNWHYIKTRSWHCPVCNTERIAHTLRNTKREAYVYVVASIKWELIKIGFTRDLDDRLFHLNKDSYWWFNDWSFLYYANYKNAWEVELELHSILKDYNFWLVYIHYGKKIRCYELFKCSYKKIKATIDSYNKNVVWIDNINGIFELKNAENLYDFSEEINTEKRIWIVKNNENLDNNILNTKNLKTEIKDIIIDVENENKKSYLDKWAWEYIRKKSGCDYYDIMIFYSNIEINWVEYWIFDDEDKCWIFRLNNWEIIWEKFDECWKIIEVEWKYFLNVKKGSKWKILNLITWDFLYWDFDYVYEIDLTWVVKVKKDGSWKVLDLETWEFDNELFDFYFEPIKINDKKYIKVIDWYVDLSNWEYLWWKFDRTRSIQKIWDKHYFSVFKDISDDECLCGLVNIEKSELIWDWFDVLDTDIDAYLDEDIEDDEMKVITHIINWEYCIKIYNKDKEWILSLSSEDIISPMFDKIKDIKLVNWKTYLIAEEDIETWIYSLEENKFIWEKFSEVIDYIEIWWNVYIKIKETNIYWDFIWYIDLNKEKLLWDFYEEVSDIEQKNWNLYFYYSYSDWSFWVYDITNDVELKNTMLWDISKVVSEKDVELSKWELKEIGEKFKAKWLNISSWFDKIWNTKTINWKQYMPVQIWDREWIYCYTDKIIVWDLYDQLWWFDEPYWEYKNCDFHEYNGKYSFLVKKWWKYWDVDLETWVFKDRWLLNNILYLFWI